MQGTKQTFHAFLLDRGLKSTRQREVILDFFLRSAGHSTAEDLYLKIRKKYPHIGFATVYRTLKLFAECGIAEERNFGDGTTRYEASSAAEHHDHLICNRCGVIIEFEDPRIEALQEQVAVDHNFRIISHRLDIYGLCASCAGN